MKKTKMLRNFMNKPGLRVIPCAYDCYVWPAWRNQSF